MVHVYTPLCNSFKSELLIEDLDPLCKTEIKVLKGTTFAEKLSTSTTQKTVNVFASFVTTYQTNGAKYIIYKFCCSNLECKLEVKSPLTS